MSQSVHYKTFDLSFQKFWKYPTLSGHQNKFPANYQMPRFPISCKEDTAVCSYQTSFPICPTLSKRIRINFIIFHNSPPSWTLSKNFNHSRFRIKTIPFTNSFTPALPRFSSLFHRLILPVRLYRKANAAPAPFAAVYFRPVFHCTLLSPKNSSYFFILSTQNFPRPVFLLISRFSSGFLP